MASEPEGERLQPSSSVGDFGAVLADLANPELLSALDLVLVELERRLLRYARIGGELLPMADEGLLLAVRAGARLNQAQSAASHTAGHLQVVGIGEWSPSSTNPRWNDDRRITGEE
jgi:hypothetical protein